MNSDDTTDGGPPSDATGPHGPQEAHGGDDHVSERGNSGHLESESASRPDRASGGRGAETLGERAAGTENARPTDKADARTGELGSEGSIDRCDKNDTHLLEELDRMSVRSACDDPVGRGERSANWIERACSYVTDGYDRQADLDRGARAGVAAFCENYDAMVRANTDGADKYFHCLANCEAASYGVRGEMVAKTISVGREVVDFPKNIY